MKKLMVLAAVLFSVTTSLWAQPWNEGEKPIIASARDVGNIAAGYMSAVNHIPYFLHNK